MEHEESNLVGKGPCDACGSSDACATYDDGHTHCFSCGAHGRADGATSLHRIPRMGGEFIAGEVQALPKRGITAETCAKFGYTVGASRSGRKVQVANYRGPDGAIVAQHTRDSEKNFAWIGDAKAAGLFGQHLWRGEGRRIVVTEGEIDAMSVAQAFGLTWEVVSIPSGAQGAKKAIQKALEFLEGYETIVLWMDNDQPGRDAVAECAPLFTPGKCKIAASDRKDANEVLLKDGSKAVSKAVYDARQYQPGGIVNGADLWERITATQTPGLPYPWAGLTEATGGQKPGTLITFTSGTGQGKSTAVAEIAYDRAFPRDPNQEPATVGYIALEEDAGAAALRFISLRLDKPAHIDGAATPEEMRRAFDETMATGRVWFYDHFGSADGDSLLSKMRYLVKGCGCTVLVLDHISIVVSGMDTTGDERRTIDQLMTALRTFVEETGITLFLVSHLRRKGNERSAEEGGRVSLDMLRGSQAIAQLSDIVVGIERDQQAEAEEDRNLALFRLLKVRRNGRTGPAGNVEYRRDTGRLVEVAAKCNEFAEDESDAGLPF